MTMDEELVIPCLQRLVSLLNDEEMDVCCGAPPTAHADPNGPDTLRL